MFKKLTLFVLLLSSSMFYLSNSGGRASTANADNTGNGGNTCQQCHNGTAFGNVFASIELSQNGQTVSNYVAGQEYLVKVTISNSMGQPLGYGFQMKVSSGTFSNPSANSKVVLLNGKNFLEHKGVQNNPEFTATWTAPASGTGDVNFYAAGNAVNGTGTSAGDSASGSTNLSITESVASNVSESIEDGRFVILSPNPAIDILNVALSNQHFENYEINIFDFNGKLYYSNKFSVASGSQQFPINISSLCSGAYFVRVSDSQGKQERKIFIKQ